MRFPTLAAAIALAACSPTFNWRDIRVEATGLKAQLPCKPDHGARVVPMAGRQVQLQVLGCDAGGATFAILTGDVVDPLRSAEVLDQWRRATLANMHGEAAQTRPYLPTGAMALAPSLRVTAAGQRADGSPVQSQAAYFARGSRVFQAVIYAERVTPEEAETFFSSLAFE
jgi:hypothetical protein